MTLYWDLSGFTSLRVLVAANDLKIMTVVVDSSLSTVLSEKELLLNILLGLSRKKGTGIGFCRHRQL